jgi:hypothetical protein
MTQCIGKGCDILDINDGNKNIRVYFGGKYFTHDIIMVKEYIRRDSPSIEEVINFIKISKIKCTIL